jgi:integrase
LNVVSYPEEDNMPVGKISKRTVDALEPAARLFRLCDTELKGFAVQVSPTGRRVYVVKYRLSGSRRVRWYTIGKHGSPWTPDTARREAMRILGEVAAGHDPAADKTRGRHSLTIGELCDLYLTEGVSTKKASTVRVDRSRITRHIKPLLATRTVAEITQADIVRFQDDVASGKTALIEKTGPRGKSIVRGGKGAARKCVNLLGAIFAFANERGLRVGNPVRGVKRYKERRLQRFLSAAEFARLGQVLADAEKYGVNLSAVAAIRLLTLTGCRKSEILTLKWDYIDWERRMLALPDSKSGAKTVPLGAPALELLSRLPHIEHNPYVLPGMVSGEHFKGLQKVWNQLRYRVGLADVRLHDLRHAFASVGASSGDSLLIIGALLGHKQQSTTQRYAHLSNDPLLAAADSISNKIAAAMSASERDGATVTPLHRSARSQPRD